MCACVDACKIVTKCVYIHIQKKIPQAYFLPSLRHAPTLLLRRCLPPPDTTTVDNNNDGLPFLFLSTIGGWVLCGAIVAISLAALGLRDAVLQQARALLQEEEEEEMQEEGEEGPLDAQPPPQPAQAAAAAAAPPVGAGGVPGEVDEFGVPMDLREAIGLQGPLKVCVCANLYI